MNAIRTAAKGKPMPPIVISDGIDLTFPVFLWRPLDPNKPKPDLSFGPKPREWAPMRKASEIPARPSMPILTKDPSLLVKVQLKEKGKAGSTLIKEYPNFAAFEAGHDSKNYPIKGTFIVDGHTVALVTAKFWVGKAKPIIEKKTTRSKTEIIAALLLRKEGCTTAEVLEACNWPAVSMPAQAKLAGLTLRKEKQGKGTRYWGSK
jgi:hypothetical protein